MSARKTWRVGDEGYMEDGLTARRAIRPLRDWYATGGWQIWEEAILSDQGLRVDICAVGRRASRATRSKGLSPEQFAAKLERALVRELRWLGVKGLDGPNRPELLCYADEEVAR